MAVVYATRDDLIASPFRPAAVTVPDAAQAARLLASASRRIDALLATAVYDVTTDGTPTDQQIAAALRDATCAQAAWWLETRDESGTAGLYQRVAIGSVQLDRSATSGGAVPDAAPRAVEALRVAGLLGGPGPWVC